jgi:hypothetical protein
MAPQSQATVREAVGVFHERDAFETAVDELLSAGFDRAEVSLLAGEHAVEDKLGHAYQKVQELEDDPAVPRAAYVGNHSLAEAKTGVIGGLAYIGAMAGAGAVVASGGVVAAAIAAAAVAGGSGALIGTFLARLMGRERAKHIEHQLGHGGLLLWVHVRDDDHAERAVGILTRNGAEDVHVHALPASAVPADNPLAGVEFDPFLPGARI